MIVVLAHPLTEVARLGVAPAFVGLLAAVLTVGVARLTAVVGPTTVPPPAVSTSARPAWLSLSGRVIGVGLLLLAVVAGRQGPPQQIDNIAPTMIIGIGWPALLLGAALLGGIWDWLNPFDTLARFAERLAGRARAADGQEGRLWLGALVGALGWTWWLAGYLPGGLEPRAVGLALGIYTLITLAGCLWAGRRAWLSQAEIFTVTFHAIAEARAGVAGGGRHRLLVMGVLIGGLAYAELRFSAWYLADLRALGIDPFALGAVLAGFVLATAAGVVSAVGALRWARRGGVSASLHVAVPWLVVGLGLSAAIERDRLWNAAQLLWIQASDPLGRGWDLWGTADRGAVVWPHGDVWRLWLQVAVLVAAAMAGLAIGLRRADGRRGEPVVVFVGAWLVLAVLSAASL